MTAQELIAELRAVGPQDQSVIFGFLADRVYEARLRDGEELLDAYDFREWLRELAEAAIVRRPRQPIAVPKK